MSGKTERARVHWWLIYTKCRQLAKIQEESPSKVVSYNDLQGLAPSCRIACSETRDLLQAFLKISSVTHPAHSNSVEHSWIPISSVWLWSYFGYQLVVSKTIQQYCDGQQHTSQELFEFYYRLSAFALPLLREIELSENTAKMDRQFEKMEKMERNHPPLESLDGFSYRQFSRALFFLLSEYCHRDIGLPRELDVENHLRKAISADTYLYTSKEWYRDHVYHAIDICILGWFLLECRLANDTILKEHFASSDAGYSDGNLISNWFLAALFHDIGYSLEEEERQKQEFQKEIDARGYSGYDLEAQWNIEKLMRTLYGHRRNIRLLELRQAQFGVMNVPISVVNEIETEREEIRQLETQLDTLITRQVPRPPNQPKEERSELDTSSAEELDHGKRSAKYVEDILISLPGGRNQLNPQYQPALDAIRNHTRLSESVSAAKDPLSFLLILCDELQDWNRPRVNPSEIREGLETQIIFSEAEPLPTRRMLDHLLMCIIWDDTNRCGMIPDNSLNLHMEYRDATEGNFEPLAVWLLKAYNLQRLQIDENILKIIIHLHHPLCRDLQKINSPDVREHYILRDFMRDQRKWRELQDWFIEHEAYHWESKKEDGRGIIETLTLNLNHLADHKPLQDDPSKFFVELFQYRQGFINGKRREL